MKKKITSVISLLLCAALALSLTACGGGVSGNDKKILEEAFYDAVHTQSFDEDVIEKAGDLVSDSEQVKVYYDTNKNFSYLLNSSVEKAIPLDYHITDCYARDFDNDGIEEAYVISDFNSNGYVRINYCDYIEMPESSGEAPMFTTTAETSIPHSPNLHFVDKNGAVNLISDTVDYGEIHVNGATIEFSKMSPISTSSESNEKDMSIFVSEGTWAYEHNGTAFKAEPDFQYKVSAFEQYFKISDIEKISGQTISSDFKNASTYEKMTIYGEEYLHILYFPDYFDLIVTVIGGTIMFVTEEYYNQNLADE